MFANKKEYRRGTPRQPGKSWLSFGVRKQKGSRTKVKYLHLPLSASNELAISLRRFRTNKQRRSTLKKQVVFTIPYSPIREICITKARRKRSQKNKNFLQLLRNNAAIASLILVGLIGTVYFGLNLNKPVKLEPIVSAQTSVLKTASPPPVLKTFPRSDPTHVRITRLGMDAPLVPVGLKTDGAMEIPSSYGVAGWYNLAPTPGELGPAIIVGHVDSQSGPAVFWRLHEAQPGDIVEIDRSDSKTIKFKVDAIKRFPWGNLPTQEVYGDINYAGIRLMTCGGVFDRQTHHYDQNIVVFGSLVY